MFRKFLKWTSNDSGSMVVAGVAAVVCSSGTVAYLGPQGMFLDKCMEYFQLYQDGYPVTLPKFLEDKGRQVLEQTSLTPKQKKAIQFFNVYGFDIYHLGTTSTKKGAAIGIPKMFSFKSPKEVENTEIHVDHNSVSWMSEAGKELKESLVLSDNAQKFAIAREIYEASYPKLHIHGIGTSVVLFATFQLAYWGHRKLSFTNRPFKLKAIWYGLSCLLGWALWISLTDMSNVYFNGECDKLAANTGKDYASGGVEYYKKKMQQNRALRMLMGSKGESYYTAHGNYNSLFRTKSIPLSHRLDTMTELLKDVEEKESTELQKNPEELQS